MGLSDTAGCPPPAPVAHPHVGRIDVVEGARAAVVHLHRDAVHALPAAAVVALDGVADQRAAHRADDGGRGAPAAATDLMAGQATHRAADHRASHARRALALQKAHVGHAAERRAIAGVGGLAGRIAALHRLVVARRRAAGQGRCCHRRAHERNPALLKDHVHAPILLHLPHSHHGRGV
jgi:hypothetical protein